MRKVPALVAVVVAVLSSACAYHSPTQPTPATTTPDLSQPSTVTIAGAPGTGAQAGTAVITARIQNSVGAPLAHYTVTFATTRGSISPSTAQTNDEGRATATLTAADTADVTVSAGPVSAHTPVTAGTPPAPGAALTVTLLSSGGQAGKVVQFSLSANAGITRADWDFGDRGVDTTTGPTTTHVYGGAATYQASVTITDTSNRTASSTQPVTITAVPTPPPAPTPVASYTVTVVASPATATVGGATTLTATVVANNGAPAPASFAWDCDNNGTVDFTTTVNSQSCTYTTAGTVTSKVTVTGGAVVGSGSTTVAVAAQAPLVVGITGALTPALGASNNYTATVTSSGAVPASLQWQWDDNGDGTPEFVTSAAASPNVRAIAFGSAGAHTIKVTVTETATGRTASGLLTVTVP
jgi:PKD repeat protein